jgi:mannosyltransferase
MKGHYLPSSSRLTLLAALAVCLLSVGLRLRELGTKPLWVDEGYSVEVAHGPLADLWHLVPNQLPAYYALLASWIHLAGDSESAVRLPSALAGASVVAAMYLIGREIGRPIGSLVGATLFAFSPFLIYWSQEAKPEAVMLGLAAWSSWILIVAWRTRRTTIWIAFAALTIVGLYTFYYYTLTVAAQALTGIVVLALRGERTRLLRWFALEAALGVTLLPWAVPHWSSMRALASAQSQGKPAGFVSYLILTANDAVGGQPFGDSYVGQFGVLRYGQFGMLTVPGLVILGLGAAGLIQLRRSWRRFPPLLIAVSVAVVLLGGWLVQLSSASHMGRYIMALTPFLFLLAGLELEALARTSWPARGAAAVAAFVVLFPWLSRDVGMYSDIHLLHAGWRNAAQFYLANRKPADVFVPDPAWQSQTFDYYLRGYAKSTILPLESPQLTIGQVQDLQAQGVAGLWTAVAVYAGSPDRLGPILTGLAVPDGLEFNDGWVAIRRHALLPPAAATAPNSSSAAATSQQPSPRLPELGESLLVATEGAAVVSAPDATTDVVLATRPIQDLDIQLRIDIDKSAAGGNHYAFVLTRWTADTNTDYAARLRWDPSGAVWLQQIVSGGATTRPLGEEMRLAQTPPEGASSGLWLREQVVGVNPTTLRIRTWFDGNQEPSTWQVTAVDEDPRLQGPGAVALRFYAGPRSSAPPLTFRFDNARLDSPG